MPRVTLLCDNQPAIKQWYDRHRFGADPFLLRDVITATTTYINTEHNYSLLERVYRESPASGAARKTAINSLALVRYFRLTIAFLYGLVIIRHRLIFV